MPGPTRGKTIVEATGATDPTSLSPEVIKKLAKIAGTKGVQIDLVNAPGKPFKVVHKPGGAGVYWGIGGCGVDV